LGDWDGRYSGDKGGDEKKLHGSGSKVEEGKNEAPVLKVKGKKWNLK
jgi:hypothetical protein